MPKIQWLHYAENRLAPLCRNPSGSITPTDDTNYTFACATGSESMAEWLGAMSLALEFYSGVPAILVPDNPNALVAEADRYE